MSPDDLDPLLGEHSPVVADVFRRLRALVREIEPELTEQLDLPDRLLAFGFASTEGVRMRDFAIGLIPHSAHVNVQLADGALLGDPDGLIEGTGKRIRHVKCRTAEDVDRPALRAVLVEQVERRRPSSHVR